MKEPNQFIISRVLKYPFEEIALQYFNQASSADNHDTNATYSGPKHYRLVDFFENHPELITYISDINAFFRELASKIINLKDIKGGITLSAHPDTVSDESNGRSSVFPRLLIVGHHYGLTDSQIKGITGCIETILDLITGNHYFIKSIMSNITKQKDNLGNLITLEANFEIYAGISGSRDKLCSKVIDIPTAVMSDERYTYTIEIPYTNIVVKTSIVAEYGE